MMTFDISNLLSPRIIQREIARQLLEHQGFHTDQDALDAVSFPMCTSTDAVAVTITANGWTATLYYRAPDLALSLEEFSRRCIIPVIEAIHSSKPSKHIGTTIKLDEHHMKVYE